MIIEHDVIIVGGGIVGLMTALNILTATNLSVALLDEKKKPNEINDNHYSSRVSAITLQSKRLLTEKGVWEHIAKRRLAEFKAMHVWEENAFLHFDAKEIGKKKLGYIIENEVMICALYEALMNYDAFSFYHGIKVASVTPIKEKIQISSENDKTFTGRLLIGADGMHSAVRSTANIGIRKQPYSMSAIVATVKTAKPHENIARQVFLTTGPLAFLPLADPHYSSIVWSLPDALAKEYMNLKEHDFNVLLTDAFSACLAHVELIDHRYVFSLFNQQASSYIAKRVALVGDAAHVVHPLAGQGVNLGINDAKVLTEVLVSAIQNHHDIASPLTLRRYERAAKAETISMIKAIDGIHHLFVAENKRYFTIRQIGMKALESCQFLKHGIMQMATGIINTI